MGPNKENTNSSESSRQKPEKGGFQVRRWKRVKTSFEMKCAMGKDFNFTVPMIAVDISEGGLRMLTPREPIQGHLVNIILDIPLYQTELVTLAEVRWVKPSREKKDWYESGVLFLGLNDEHQKLLYEYVAFHIA